MQRGYQKTKDYVYILGFDVDGYQVSDVSFNNVRLVDVDSNVAFKAQYVKDLVMQNISYVKSE